jgi:hypothetical protein
MIAWRRLFLAVPGLALLGLDLAGLRFEESDELPWVIAVLLAQGAVYIVAALWVASRRPAPLGLIVVFAALLRLPLLFSEPYLSDDVYRYVWDGRVQAAGINPYRYVPDAPELESLRDEDVYPNINRGSYAVTIYPPAAQLFFLLATRVSESITWMKAALLGWEALAIALLVLLLRRAGQPEGLVLLYAWHPLPLWEFAASGHLDAAAMACILAALLARAGGKRAVAGVALGVEPRAEVAGRVVAGEVGALAVEERLGAHDDAGRAEPALQCPGRDERVSDAVPVGGVEALDRGDRAPLDLRQRDLTADLRLPVDEHGAAPALTRRRAAVLGRHDVELLAQRGQQVGMVARHLDGAAVQRERGHAESRLAE